MPPITECVDCIARTRSGDFIITERVSEPRGLALPGGRVNSGELTVVAAERRFKEKTGLQLRVDGFFRRYDDPNRDTRYRSASNTFTGVVDEDVSDEDLSGKRVVLLSPEECSRRRHDFVFDHAQIIDDFCAARIKR